jgi:hypothetical protein
MTNAGENVTNKEPLYTVDGNTNEYNHYRKQYRNHYQKAEDITAM